MILIIYLLKHVFSEAPFFQVIGLSGDAKKCINEKIANVTTNILNYFLIRI